MPDRLRRVFLADGSAPARAAAVVALVVAVALIAAGSVALFAVRGFLADQAESAARSRAEAVARDAAAGRGPGRLGAVPSGDGNLVQVVAADGRVLVASENLAGRGPVAAFAPPAGRRSVVETVRLASGLPDPRTGDIAHAEPFRVVAVRADTPDGPVVAYAGASLNPMRGASHALLWVMLPGLPLLVAITAFATYRQASRMERGGGPDGSAQPDGSRPSGGLRQAV
jgi:hypothetical protein